MFQALVQRLLNKILGEYIENFSAENLKIGIWSGQVILKNVILKKSIIKKLNLPLKIKYSRLGCLRMSIPWKSLTSSKLEVVLEGFELVVAELPSTMWECKNTKIIEKRKKEIQSFCETVLSDFAKKNQKAKDNSQQGYFSKLVMKIIDNLQVTIKDIHIRYEDDLSKMQKSYSFGVTLEQFKLYTVNSKGEPEYIDRSKPEYANEPLRKRLELYNIGIYWNERSEIYKEQNYEQKMKSTIARRGQAAFSHNYVVLMSSQAQLLQRQPGKQFSEPQINLQIQLENLKLQITNTQLQQIIILGQRLQKYTRKVKEENKQKLSKEQIISNQQFFIKIFPDYYNGWGKGLSKDDMQRIQKILQKMQVQNFTKGINQYLQAKQKERIIKQKQEKNRGWWFGKPKQLTAEQLEQIQKYLNNNFGQEVKIIKRPPQYHYIRIGFKLQKLQVVIANNLAMFKEGIQARFDELAFNFTLREGGYGLNFTLEDIAISMFKQIGVQAKEYKQILFKLDQSTSKLSNSYLSMSVVGNPLDKKHLNTDIKLVTSELMAVFDPKIISIALQFVDLNVSIENKEAALQKFGQIKQKTEAVVSETIDKPSKAQIGVDVMINSITIAVPFTPKRPNDNCWSLNLGSIHFTTDEKTLLRLQATQNLPLDVFNLQLTEFSFKHYTSINALKQYLTNKENKENLNNSLVQHLDFRLRVQAFSKATETQAKIRIEAILPTLSINLNEFTYKNLLKIGDAFQQQSKIAQQRMTARIDEKKQIQKKASKIGFVHIKDSLTKIWKKYVAIMTDNYIYLYLNKNDKDYYAYYYIKGAKLQKINEPLDKEKPYHFRIKNKVNQVVFGFDKQQQIDDWINKINDMTKQQQFVSQVVNVTALNALSGIMSLVANQKKHNQLNLFVSAQIETIKIKVFTSESLNDKVVKLKFTRLSSKIFLHESKKRIQLQLFDLELQDTIQYYKNKDLTYFLQTKRKSASENLINVQIQQLNKDHPKYDHTDSSINVSFGTLFCNYKCETVKTLMAFFIPSSQTAQNHIASLQADPSVSINTSGFLQPTSNDETYSLKLNVKIQEISVILVNQKIKTILGRIGITNLNLYMGISQQRMILQGSLKDLYFIDTSSYPQTIYKQQQLYKNQRYILTANIGQDKSMLDFNIQILKQMTKHKKKMFIDLKLANLTAYYVQQPVLRLITYLNTQMLPSFETGPKQQKKLQCKDTKPDPSPMDLRIVLTNISVFVETQYIPHDRQRQEYMQLNIERITVNNDSIYKSYLKQQNNRPIILVQNYLVNILAMSISVHYFDINQKRHKYKLTNNLDLSVSTDLIANPEYYKKQLPQKFDNGLRVECIMKPFFMRMNHDDYSFIMKCLNWGITHNDGLDDELFDIPVNAVKVDSKNQPEKDPFYLKVQMDCISLFITDEIYPIAFLLLDNMTYSLCIIDETLKMDLQLKNLYGTSIQQHRQEKTLSEIGIFNSLGYTSKHKMDDLSDLESYFKVFDRRGKVSQIQKPNILSCIITISPTSLDIQIVMDELWIDVDVRLLMILSTLANTDEKYIKGPQPIKRLNAVIEKQNIKTPPKKLSLLFTLQKIVGSVSDSKKQKFAFIQGGIIFTMLNYGDKTIQQIDQISFRKQIQNGINHSSMTAALKRFTVYFSKIKDEKIITKRQFLRPIDISFDLSKTYKKHDQLYLLTTDISFKIQQIILSATFKDLLNVSKILQDNLKVLEQFKTQVKQEIKTIQKQDIGQQLKKLEQKIAKEIQLKTKIKGKIAPIQIQIINDCDNNFMPVLRLFILETQPAMSQTIIKTQIFIVPIISLYFFNPRSSRQEPIIQPFKTFINYTAVTINNESSSSISIKTNQIAQDTASLKINVSTQLFSTIMATKDIILAEKQNIEKNIQTKEIQISPFIFYNVTNEKIYLIRKDNEYELSPLFKGPIRLNSDKIVFRLRNQTYKFSLQHYGVLKIPQSNYFLKFDTQKLNRIIKFLPLLIIKNRLHQAIYIKRFGNIPQLPKKVEKNQPVPLDNVDAFAVSLNGNSYTQKIQTKALKLTGFLLAEKKNFVVLLKYKQRVDRFTFVNLLPPLIIYNCLPKNLNLQFIQKAKTKSTVSINAQQSYSVFTSEDINQLQIKAYINGYIWSNKFKYRPQHDTYESQLVIEDEDNFKTALNYIYKKNTNTNQFILIIYCKKIIVNQFYDKLLVYGNFFHEEKEKRPDTYQLLGGQRKDDSDFDDKIILVGEEVGNKIRVCGSSSIIDFATPIMIGGIGSSQSRIVVDRQYEGKKQSLFTVIGVEIDPIKMMKQCDIFSKKIILKSKSIIINLTKRDMTITQELSTQYKFVCEAGCKKNFVFGMPEIQNKHYKYIISCDGLKPSKLINLPAQGTNYFKLVSLTQLDKKGKKKQNFFKIYVQDVKSYIFYEISEITREDLPYQLVVKSRSILARIPTMNIMATRGQDCKFFNQSQEEKHFVEIVINHDESKEEMRIMVCPDDLKFKQKQLISVQRGGLTGSAVIVVQVTVRDKQRTIVIDEQTRIQEEKQIQKSSLIVQLNEVVISINQNSQTIQSPYESMVITFKRIFFIKYETDKKVQYQAKLGFFQIDQAYPFLISSPVILTPHKFEQFTRADNPKSIFNFTIVFSKQFVKNTFISELSVDIDDIVATFSADFINLATLIFTQFGEVANFKENTYFVDKKVQKWKQLQVPPQGKNVFIKSIRISPFVIDLSAQLNIKKLNLQNQLLKTLISTVGIVMSNIDAPIQMTGIQINDCIDTFDSIINQLIAHYKTTCVNQFYKLFGSLNIIGNPLSLFRNISTGVKDLKEKPAQGFVNGPAQFGIGIVQGTGSLIAHSVGGAFNSISKITGTFSTGLATLSFDKDFQEHRQKQKMKKPQNVIQGLSKGGKAILYGFKQGFTGVFTQPYQNAKKQGALGFMKGAAKGLAGLVVKPVTGIIDFASKTTEGIKNNALMFEDKANETRMRNPRVFYTECYILKEYSHRDSQLYAIMRKMQNQQKFQNPIFIDAFQTSEQNEFLVILQDSIVYIDVKSRHIKWIVDYSALQLQDNKQKKMIFFKRKARSSSFFNVCCTSIKVDFEVEIQSDQIRENIVEIIHTLMNQRNYH